LYQGLYLAVTVMYCHQGFSSKVCTKFVPKWCAKNPVTI